MSGVAVGFFEFAPECAHGWGEVCKLLEMCLGERVELGHSSFSERDADSTVVGRVGVADDQPGYRGAVDQPDGAVVAQHQVVGDLADGGAGGIGVAADREQQLMLRGREPGRLGLLLAPAQEAA